ncbi:PAS domain-containing protein [Gemmatirosa kalamazoonensis]|uniref:PAS domain-containing protein n=1 Tax=Gemmatirosa kalamazoonensis TaxID=861299 RepID=UPI0004B9A567|nr:PAS domain-containing protein [Gemmatirosa kalamazoonensis]
MDTETIRRFDGHGQDDAITAWMRASLNALVTLMERVAPGMRGSVLLLDDDGVTLRNGAAPNLPEAYCRAIDGERIGPAAGSCGTAAYRRARVIVRDIATDPLWADYRAVAEPFGLAACWSTPIFDAEGRILGTFAMYYDEPREPTAADVALTETATLLSANIITRARVARALRARTESAEQLAAALRQRETELRSSHARLRAALDASSTSTWEWDMRTNAVDCDEGLFRLFGVDPAEASGSFELFVSHIHADDRDRVIAAAQRCARDGGEFDEEFRTVWPDGSLRWAVDKGKVVLGDDGRPRFLIGACVDVTDRRVRDAQFRALAESIPQLAWMADADGAIYWYNERWYEYTGTTLEDVRGWGWTALQHPEHVERVVERIRRSFDTGEPWEDTFPLRGRDGRYRWFLSRAQPIRDANARIVRWFGTNTDINELREVEQARDRALAAAQFERQRLYEVFMQAPAAIAVLEGPAHVFTVANPRYQELIGGRDVIGAPVRDALPELLGQGFFELLDDVFRSGTVHSERERVVRLDKRGDGVPEEVFVDFVYQPLEDAGGTTFGVLVHAVDVTGQVRARQEIAAARVEAERANRAKSDFLAAMSHDLRTPLNAIGGYADLTAEGVYGPVNDAERGAMERIRKASDHLLSLINDILGFAKVEAGRIHLRIADVAVNEVVSGAVSMVEPQAAGKGLSLHARLGADEIRVRADPERLTQILTNLLTNAVKFTTTGAITVEWQADEHTVRIAVRDTGRGIPAEKLAAVFEPFVQAGRSAEEQRQGVGLGLAISRELARAMGGDLTLESALGAGSTFTLRLPRGA